LLSANLDTVSLVRVRVDKSKKIREVYISPYCRQAPVRSKFMKFGIRGQVTDVITHVKFLVNRFRNYDVLIPQKLPFPIDLLRRSYSNVCNAVRHCDQPFFFAHQHVMQAERDIVMGKSVRLISACIVSKRMDTSSYFLTT